DALEPRAVAEGAAQRIAGVRGVGDQTAVLQHRDRLLDQTRLRILRVDVEILRRATRSGHTRWYAAHPERVDVPRRQATTTNSRPIHLVRRSRRTALTGSGPLMWG